MTGLGKAFAVLNLLIAAGFIYLALMDLDARKQWAASALQHQLALDGLPLDNTKADGTASIVPFPYLFNRTVRIDEVDKSVITNYLAENGGAELGGSDFLTSQTEEVKRVQNKVKEAVNALPDTEQKLRRLQNLLVNIAQSAAERNGVNALLRDLHDAARRETARRELNQLGKSARQQAALESYIAIIDLEAAPMDAAKVDAAKKSLEELVAILGFRGGSPEAGLEGPVQELQANRLATSADLEMARAKLSELATLGQNEVDSAATKKIIEVIQLASKGNSPELQKLAEETGIALLDSKFNDAAAPLGENRNLDAVKQQSEITKRVRIAHLLYHLDSDRPANERDAWQRRVLRIVGISAYADVVEAQATRLADMVLQMNAVISADQRAFLPQYSEAVQLCLFRASKAEILVNQLIEQQQIEKNHKTTVEQRQTELEDLNKNLDQLKTEGKAKLTDLSETQKKLFTLTNQVREAQDELVDLEGSIRNLEDKIKAAMDKGR